MKGKDNIVIVFLTWISFSNVVAQVEGDSAKRSTPVEGLKYKQQPGLALAASKIFFSEKRYSISGFGEFNYIPVQTGVNTNLGDLELYYSGLYRFATCSGRVSLLIVSQKNLIHRLQRIITDLNNRFKLFRS